MHQTVELQQPPSSIYFHILASIMLGVVLVAVATLQPTEDWQALRISVRTAYKAHDYERYRSLLAQLLNAMHGHSDVLYSLGVAEALCGHDKEALLALKRYARTGLVPREMEDADLQSLARWPEFHTLQELWLQNRKPILRSQPAFTVADTETVPEDIAYDPVAKQFYLSSTRLRKVIRIGTDGVANDFLSSGQDGIWAALGLAIDAKRRRLWVSTAATEEVSGYPPEDAGRTAVLEYGLDDRRLRGRYEVPKDGKQHLLGDIALMPDGRLIACDAFGMVYRVEAGVDGMEPLTAAGVFASAQQPAPFSDGTRVLIADYALGIASIDLVTKQVSWLRHPPDLALNGIDGFYLLGDHAIAIQNGTVPMRLLQLDLNRRATSIVGWRVIEQQTEFLTEPTHGVVVNDDFIFIANRKAASLTRADG